MSTMPERIKELRKALGLTQQEFAERIGIKRNTVATYEMGRSEPSAAALSLICREFGVNEAWLRDGTGDMLAAPPADAVEALVQEYGLRPSDAAVVRCYMDMGPKERDCLLDFAKRVAASTDDEPEPIDPAAWQRVGLDPDNAQQLQELDRQLSLEKRRTAKSGAS